LEEMMKGMAKEERARRKKKFDAHHRPGHTESAPTIGVPSFVNEQEKPTRKKKEKKAAVDDEWLPRPQIVLTKRQEELSRPGSALNYEEFKERLNERKKASQTKNSSNIPPKISEETM
jgi:hypothetical protein